MSEATSTRRQGRVTIVDVAAHAGVSTASVSKVLRNAYGTSAAMHERVQLSMEALGFRAYKPARGMRGRTFTIGMMVPDVENPYFNLLSRGIGTVLAETEYELLIAAGGDQPRTQRAVIDALIDHQMDGLLLVAPLATDAELEEIAAQLPIVVVGRHSGSNLVDSVAGDDALGAALVVRHLTHLGHRRIGFVRHSAEHQHPFLPQERRLVGFEHAIAEQGVEGVVLDGRWTLDGGKRAAQAYLDLPVEQRPTAVHAGADVTALGMLDTLWNADVRVPEHLSLAGYDNSSTSGLGMISLSTVDQDGPSMGARAAQLLLERIDGRAEPVHAVLEPRFIPRGTTTSPRHM